MFLKYNGFPQKFYPDHKHKQPEQNRIKIAETGFGTGLNCLTTLWHWSQIAEPKCAIDYFSVEKYPLNKSQLQRIYRTFTQKWSRLKDVCEMLLQQYPDNVLQTENRQHEVDFFDQQFRLKLLLDDATSGLQQLLPEHKNTIDAWYLDGFAPAKNPDMWQPLLFQTMAKLSKPGATLSTFTAAGFVRRGLTDVGFNMLKAPGFGNKRELLYGIKPADK